MTTSDIIQIVLMGLLVLVTGIYAWRTHVISKAAREQADASVKMAEEMREQRYDSVRPVIEIQWRDSNSTIKLGELMEGAEGNVPPELRCKLCNIGIGPAIDLYSFTRVNQDNHHRYDFGPLKAGGQTDEIQLSVHKEGSKGILEAYYRDIYDRTFRSKLEVYPVKGQGLQTKLWIEEVSGGNST